WQKVSTGSGGLIDNHDFRTLDGSSWCFQILAVPRGPIADEGPAENIDVIIRNRASPIESLIDDDGVLVRLRVEVTFEVVVSGRRSIGHVDIGHASSRGLLDLLQISLHPVAIA